MIRLASVTTLRGSRRADTGSGAAAFVLLLVLIIIGYILAVDPLFRDELLNGGNRTGNGGPGSGGTVQSITLLHKEPGRLELLKDDHSTQVIDSLRIEEKEEAITVLKDRTVFVDNGLFTEQSDELVFALTDPAQSDLVLSFQARTREGRLVIQLNGKVVFSEEMSGPTPNPIPLPKEYLKENNVLSFRVSGPGFAFWTRNKYLLEKVQVAGQFRNVRDLSASRNFIVHTDDLLNTKEVRLDFTPVCLVRKDQGSITLSVNDRVVSEGLPVCDSPQSVRFTSDKLVTGDNIIRAQAASGKYVLEPVKVTLLFKEPSQPSYFFDLNAARLTDITSSSSTANLKLAFVDDSQHSLTIYVNGHAIHVDGTGQRFSYNVESFLQEGTNAVKVVPQSSGIGLLSLDIVVE